MISIWFDFLSFLVCLYATIKFYRKLIRTRELIFASFTISTLSMSVYFLTAQLFILIGGNLPISEYYLAMTKEWSGIVSISFTLVGLAILIRNAKPEFARFPLSFTALPLLLIAVHPLAMDTIVLKYWLIGIYQGGAILISFLMYSVITMHDKKFMLILASVVLYALSFATFWFADPILTPVLTNWIWKPIFSGATLLAVYGYDCLEEAYLSFETVKKSDEFVSESV